MYNDKIKVLHVCGTMNHGGSEMMLMNLFRNISDRFEFIFLINVLDISNIPQGVFDEEISNLGGRIFYIGAQWSTGLKAYLDGFKKIVKQIGSIDIVHSHMNSKGGVIALAAKQCGIKKIIVHSHADIHFDGPLHKRVPHIIELQFQKVLIALYATDYWACSTQAVHCLFYSWLTHKNRPVIIRNAIEVKSFSNISNDVILSLKKEFMLNEDSVVIGNFGRINHKKNVFFLINVLKRIKEKIDNISFIYAGRIDNIDYKYEIDNLVKKLGLEKQVFYIGDRSDIPQIVSLFDVFVSSSVTEGFGMVALEAQAAGVPCVLSNGFPSDVDMGLDIVKFMKDYDEEKWAEAIISFQGRKNNDKQSIFENIASRGYDIIENAKRIESLYLGGN